MLHVRFIAINDDFDNIRQSDVDSLAVPIKNMVNSLYAKDISKKISLSYQMRREKGIPTSWCTPYGYQLNQQGNKLEATEDAKWVKLIYQWYLAGVSTNEIARRLEFLEVARPNERLNRKLHEGDDPTYNKWHPSTVLRILNSSTYIGELVSGKTQTASYKGIGFHPVEKREWHAECVITNSFHGMIFAVQYCRPFYVFSREQCDTKITELLDLFGLSDHMLVTEAEKKNMSEINYEEVHSRIAEARKESLEFLNTELTSCV